MYSWKKMEKNSEFNPIIIFTTLLLSVILLWSITKRFLIPAASKRNLPPSPRKLPIIGNVHQLSSLPHRDLHSMAKKHGPIMLLHFGSSPVLIVSSADWAREIMKNHDIIFASRPDFKVCKKLFYGCRDVAFSPYGENWRKMKSVMVLQLLSSKRVQSARSIKEEETALLVRKIRESSGAVNLSEMLAQLATDELGTTAFGKRYSESDNRKRFLKLLPEFMELLGKGFVEIGEYIPWLSWISRVNGVDKRIDRVAKEMYQVLESVIQERMQDFNGKDEECFIDIMLQIYNGEYADLSIERESIKPLILDIFIGGMDTTFTILEWIMSEILHHPMVMEKLQQEVRGIVEKKQEITQDDIDKMHYLKAVIKESFRLHPPAPVPGPRVARQDVKINGYDVSAGTTVIINLWAIGRDPVYWDEPEKFKPERFLNSSIDLKGLDFELIPFGSGRRGCPGSASALATIEIVLANLVHKFDWKLANGVQAKDLDMSESPGATAHRLVPLLVVASTTE